MLSVGNFFYYLLTCSKMQQANYMHVVCNAVFSGNSDVLTNFLAGSPFFQHPCDVALCVVQNFVVTLNLTLQV